MWTCMVTVVRGGEDKADYKVLQHLSAERGRKWFKTDLGVRFITVYPYQQSVWTTNLNWDFIFSSDMSASGTDFKLFLLLRMQCSG